MPARGVAPKLQQLWRNEKGNLTMTFVKHISAKLWTLILTLLLTRFPSPNCLHLLQSTFIAGTQLFLAAERNFCGLFGSNNENKTHGGQIKVQSTGKKVWVINYHDVFSHVAAAVAAAVRYLNATPSTGLPTHLPPPLLLPRCSDKLRSDTLSALVKRRRERERTRQKGPAMESLCRVCPKASLMPQIIIIA